MKLRKIAAMTMAVAMLGGTLAGCGGAASSTASSSADSTPAESTSTAESTETSGEKVNIKLFTGKIETIDVMNEIIDEFNASQDHIVVEQEYLDGHCRSGEFDSYECIHEQQSRRILWNWFC